jgi:hypothetical protein
MKRVALILAMMCLTVGGAPQGASAGAKPCFYPLYAGYWTGCMNLVGSQLHVDKVTSQFLGVKDSNFTEYLKHRLCIDFPTGTDACYTSGIRLVSGYDNLKVWNEYNFNKGGNYPNNTIMCTYIYQTNYLGQILAKKVGPLCATIHS